MRESNIVFPMTRFSHVEKILFALDEKKGIKRENLAEITKLGQSVISNTVPILKDLGILGSKSIWRDKLVLTPEGKELVQYIKTNRNGEMKLLARRLLENSKVLDKAYRVLRNNQSLKSFELGRKLAEEFDKKWEHSNTPRVVGRACKSLLNGFGIIKCQVAETPEKEYGTQKHTELLPTASSNKILMFLREMPANEPFQIPFARERGKRVEKLKTEFNSLIDLGIVKRVRDGSFELTEIGRRLKQAETSTEESRIFKEILMSYEPTLEVIKWLAEKESAFGLREVGKAIDDCFGKKRKDSTLRGYGIKFLTWLKKANIVAGNDEYGKYRLIPLTIDDLKLRRRAFTIPAEEERKVRKFGDGYSKILEFNQHFADILADPSWYRNHRLKEEMKGSLSQLKTIDADSAFGILIDPIGVLIDVAYEKKDIELIREVAKTGIKLRERFKDLGPKNRQN